MAIAELSTITNVVQEAAQPIGATSRNYDSLLKLIDTRLSDQFDAVIHFDETRALEPLERYALWETGEPPETFPTGV